MSEAPDDSTSLRSIARAVTREGARWGLEAHVVDGKVKVCDRTKVAEARNGLGEIVSRPRPLCTVDDEAPFSAALMNRVDNGETDLARRYRLHDEQVKAAQEKHAAEYDEETRRIWRRRNSIIALPTGILPAGLANRARRMG